MSETATAAAAGRKPRFHSDPTPPKSPLEGVPDAAWGRLVTAFEVQPTRAVSASGGLGAYDLRPRELVESGLATNLRYVSKPGQRAHHECDLLPQGSAGPQDPARLREAFLRDPLAQLAALGRVVSRYHQQLMSGELQVPQGLSVAGAIALLRRGGRGALASWPDGTLPNTRSFVERAREAF